MGSKGKKPSQRVKNTVLSCKRVKQKRQKAMPETGERQSGLRKLLPRVSVSAWGKAMGKAVFVDGEIKKGGQWITRGPV